jgi:predicted MFS family arabinose efflux permease
VLEVLLRPGIAIGMFGCVLVHTGHFALFTYIRPFLESTTGVGAQTLALMLLGFGVANFAGTLFAGWLLQRNPRATLVLMPVLVGVAALALVGLPASLTGQALLLALWGMAFGGVPVAWSNWVARSIPDQAESAGGMVVASVQSAIAAGAAAGGSVFSFSGIHGVFVAAGILMLLAALLIALKVNVDVPEPGSAPVAPVHL